MQVIIQSEFCEISHDKRDMTGVTVNIMYLK